jgi:hypothetical protein
VLDFLRAGRYPDDPRELLAQIVTRYPDREKALRIFTASVVDHWPYLRAVVACAFETWTARPPQ